MGAVLAKGDIYDTFMTGSEGAIEFFHGYTYSGHPLAAAAACATLDVYQEEGLFERARSLEGYFEDGLHSLKGEPYVIDVRNFGLIGAVELEPIKGQPTARAVQLFVHCFDNGVSVRTTGDTVAFRQRADQWHRSDGRGIGERRHTHNLEKNAFSRGLPKWGAHLADELENIVALHDASTIAAVIVEPVAGSAGVILPPEGYLQRLRDICNKHGILLIFDEVI